MTMELEAKQRIKRIRQVVTNRIPRKIRTLSHKKKFLIILALVALIVIVTVIVIHSQPTATQGTGVTSGTTTALPKGTPNFQTILPAGKSITKLGGWTRISPLDKNSAYVYSDTVSDIAVDVSEQPLPANFKSDPSGQLAKLAQGFDATQKVAVGATTYYIATALGGQQSIILSKSDLLVLIKTAGRVSVNDLTAYINSLQ
jgi:hypothetical protein